MRTHIVKKNAYPVFDELFQFDNLASITDESSSLVFTVSTYDTFTRDEIVGEVIFPLRLSMVNSTEMTFTHDITPRCQQVREIDPLRDLHLAKITLASVSPLFSSQINSLVKCLFLFAINQLTVHLQSLF